MDFELLIVEDDLVFTWLQEKAVKKGNLHPAPKSFMNGQEAMEYLDGKGSHTSKHLVFLDINMPVMDGWAFLDNLGQKTYLEQVKVIMLTSSVETSDRQRAEGYNQVIGFLEKPLSAEMCSQIAASLDSL